MSLGFGRLNDIAYAHWKWVEEMGWHNSTVLEKLALVTSEVGEAINECRHDELSDKFGSELADIVLRVFDMAECYNINIEQEIVNKMTANSLKGNRGRTI